MSNDLTDEQKKRLIERLEKDAIERRKKDRKKIILTLKKKENSHENTGFARSSVNPEMS